jgi:hypothetical protein
MKQNWQKSRNNIPTRVRTGIRKFFAVLWADTLFDTKGNKLYGLTYFDPLQIIISKDQSDKEAVYTAWHEFLHGIDHDHDIGLTEPQVVKLEKCYPFIREFILTLEGKKKK